ncbi:MAG TPA: RsmE family RNA methyltransferase [Opitutales bacterium]|nr:RsmE family RNA methyltransferase [Opitutales bacterium]
MAHYRSFLLPGAELLEGSITLDKRESHHLVKVFRARAGERVEVLDGRGQRYFGRITRADAKAAAIEIEEVAEVAAPRQRVTLLQALPKGKAMDLILRTATEIGASAVQPIYTSQSEVRFPDERVEGKLEKWRATTIEASKQCGLPFLPELGSPMDLRDWLGGHPPEQSELRIVASLETGSRLLADALASADLPDRIVLAVGPEGDFSEAEYTALREGGFVPVRLGDNVLRAETAVAYILGVIDQFARRGRPSG